MAFDEFYFVEKNKANFKELKRNTVDLYPNKKIYAVDEDCNQKMLSMSKFLKSEKGKKTKVLSYIDPCGMQLEWKSLEALKDDSIDMWILIPTGMGVNRLLTSSGYISEPWLKKLSVFLGMSIDELKNFFYETKTVKTLFGDEETMVRKLDKAIDRSAELYIERLNKLFKHVSKPYILRNKANTTMYHFLMVSNNEKAVNIANDIVKKYKFK